MVIEEILYAYKTLKRTRKLLALLPYITVKKPGTFFGVKCAKLPNSTELIKFVDIPETGDIMLDDQSGSFNSVNIRNELTAWYTHVWDDMKHKLQLVLMENSNQFTYQTAKLVFEFIYPNLLDARYSSSVLIFRLRSGMTIFSIALSVYSIFTPVLNRECILSCIKHKRLPNPFLYVIKCIQIILHLVLSTGSVVLLGSTSFVDSYFLYFSPFFTLSYNMTHNI